MDSFIIMFLLKSSEVDLYGPGYFLWSTEIQTDFSKKVENFTILVLLYGLLAAIWLLRWVAESKEELGRLLFRYSEYQSGPGTYLNEQHEVR